MDASGQLWLAEAEALAAWHLPSGGRHIPTMHASCPSHVVERTSNSSVRLARFSGSMHDMPTLHFWAQKHPRLVPSIIRFFTPQACGTGVKIPSSAKKNAFRHVPWPMAPFMARAEVWLLVEYRGFRLLPWRRIGWKVKGLLLSARMVNGCLLLVVQAGWGFHQVEVSAAYAILAL